MKKKHFVQVVLFPVMIIFLLSLVKSNMLYANPEKPKKKKSLKTPLNSKEKELRRLINDIRKKNDLPSIPVTKSLTLVARLHVRDLHHNHPDTGTDSRGMECNLHSWSEKGKWTPVCYTSDHNYASKMWSKPKEITNNKYTGNGYEIAYICSGADATPSGALESWKNSQDHLDVILERGTWTNRKWPAMGVGIYKEYAVVWFGDKEDPSGKVPDKKKKGT